MKERIIWVDFLKATLIFLMVLGHSSQQGLAGEVLSSFHMPAFFMVSGFLYHYREPKKLLRSFVYPFVIFYLLWMIKMQAINIITEGSFIEGYLYNTLAGLVSSDLSIEGGSSFPGYWFLIVLLIIRVYAGDFALFRKISHYRMNLSLSIIVIFAVLIFLFPRKVQFISNIYLVKAVVCFPFFYLGMYVKESGNKKLFTLSPIWLIILFASSLIFSSINGPVNVMLSEYGMSYCLFLLNTLPMTLFLINIYNKIPTQESVRMLGWNKLNSLVITISNGTLLILGIHGILIGIFKMAFQNTSFWENPLRPLCCAICVIIICYPLIIFAKKYVPILLGK